MWGKADFRVRQCASSTRETCDERTPSANRFCALEHSLTSAPRRHLGRKSVQASEGDVPSGDPCGEGKNHCRSCRLICNPDVQSSVCNPRRKEGALLVLN